MALAMLKYVRLGSGEEAGLTTDALQVHWIFYFIMNIIFVLSVLDLA